jgi:glycosyltransferase involved in cell wall biosynthesis
MQQADRLGITPYVHFHGHLNNPYPLMQRCDLLVLPSHYEGLPNVMLEAMVCRCPVLATDTQQGAGEFLRNHPFGRLVPVKNPKAMAAEIADRFKQPTLWTSVLDDAEQYTRHHHGLSHWIESLSELFEKIAKAPKS